MINTHGKLAHKSDEMKHPAYDNFNPQSHSWTAQN